MKNLLVLFILFSSVVYASVTHYAKFDTSGESCVRLTSDKSKLVTFAKNRVDVWCAKDLKLLSSIKSINYANDCRLSTDDRYFFIHSHETIYMYDLKKEKLYKEFKSPPRTLIFTMSLSKDEKFINTVEARSKRGPYGNKEIYRYKIDTAEVEKVFSIKKRSASYILNEDIMYAYDNVQRKSYSYNILTKNRKSIDKKVYDKHRRFLRGTQYCSKESPLSNLCILDNNILYTMKNGLSRADIKSVSTKKPSLTYLKTKPLREISSFEIGINNTTAIVKAFNIYLSWNIKNGKLNWVNDLKLNMSVEGDYSPIKGIAYFNKRNHVLIAPPFGSVFGKPGNRHGGIMDFDLKDGSFTNLDVAYTGFIVLSKDDEVLAIRNYDGKVYFYKTQDYTLLSKAEVKKYKKQIIQCNKILDERYKRKYEIEDKKFNYTMHKDGMTVKSEIYTGKVVAKKKLAKRYVKLNLISNGRVLLTENRKYFTLYRSKDFKELAKFYAFKDNEWLVLTPEGYFNASSQNIMGNLLKLQNRDENSDIKNELLQKYFRPDIVSALLQEKSIKQLQNKMNEFKLSPRLSENSASVKNSYAGILKSRDYKAFYKLRKYKSPELMQLAQDMIKKASSKREYKISYRVLSMYNFDLQEEFIRKRVENIKFNSFEESTLIKSLFRNKDLSAKYFIKKLQDSSKTPIGLKLEIAKNIKAKDLENSEVFLWKTWKELGFISPDALKYLSRKNPQKAKEFLNKSRHVQEKKAKEKIISLYAKKVKAKDKKVSNRVYYDTYKIYQKLLDMNASSDMKEINKIAMKEISSYYSKDILAPNYSDVFLNHIYKYGSEKDKFKVQKYLKKSIDSFANKKPIESIFDMNKILKHYDKYNHEYVVQTLIKYSSNKYKKLHYHVFSTMKWIQDEAFIPILIKNLGIDKRIMKWEALMALLKYDEETIMLTVQELNKLDECSKISSLDMINSMIEDKLSKENFKLYRCGNE